MHFRGLVGKEVVGKIICKYRGFAPETMWGAVWKIKIRLYPC